MGALTDPKHEAFARFITQGNTKREAAILAGFSKKTASSQGTQLAKRAKIAKRIEELQAQVAHKTVELATKSIELEIASKQSRIRLYDDILSGLKTIARERAADPTMANVPGGKTGFVVRQIKALGAGKAQRIVPEYVADTGLVRAMQSVAQQAAEELGQWKDGESTEAEAPKAAFPEWLLQEWKERGSISRSEASENSTPTETSTKAIPAQWDASRRTQ